MPLKDTLVHINDFIEDKLSLFGRFISRHPYAILISLVVVWGSFLAGFSSFTTLDSLTENWVPYGSVVHDQVDFIDEYFTDTESRLATMVGTPVTYPGHVPNILTTEFLSELYSALQKVLEITITFKGSTYSWYDICDKSSALSPCIVSSVFYCFNQGATGSAHPSNPFFPTYSFPYLSLLDFNTATQQQLFDSVSVPCNYPIFTPASLETFAGGVTYDSEGKPNYIASLQIIFAMGSATYAMNAKSDDNVDTIEKGTELMRAFEKAFLDTIESIDKNDVEYPLLRYDRSAVRSITDTEEEVTAADAPLLVIGYCVIFVFVVVLNVKLDTVRSQTGLAMAGVVLAVLSIASSFGFMAAVGIPYTPPSIQVLPFLAIGLAVDDMFVLLNAFKFDPSLDASDMLAGALKEAGVSITLTSAVNCVAFIVGAFSPVPGVRVLSAGAAILVFFNWVTLVFGFSALLFLDAKRMKNGRRDFMFCIGASESANASIRADPIDIEQSWGCQLGRYILHPVSAVLVLGATGLILGFAIYGTTKLEYGLTYSEILPEDYYYQNWWETQEDFYFYYSFNLYAGMDKDGREIMVDWETQYTDFQQTQDALKAHPNYDSVTSWIDDFVGYCGGSFNYSLMPAYRADVTKSVYLPQFIYKDGVVTKAYVSFVYLNIKTTRAKINVLEDIKNTVKNANNGPFFAYSLSFSLAEQFIGIRRSLVVGLVVVGVAVFVVSLLFLLNPIANVYMIATISVIVVDVIGFLHFANLQMNGITVVNLIMAVGIAVEFTAHYTRTFMIEQGTRKERATKALGVMAYPLIVGGLSTFLGTLPLAFAKFPYYQLYFFMQYALIVAFGVFHGLFFLPVLLSLIGPEPLTSSHGRIHSPRISTAFQPKTISGDSRD